jgi:hypothetical protein
VGIYKDPEKWGGPAEGLYFTIVPYQQYMPTKGVIEATAKYSPMVKIGQDSEIANYEEIAGWPFPKAKTGWEMASNFDFNNHGDSAHYRKNLRNIDPKKRNDVISDSEYWELYWIHRTEVEPLPALPKNKKRIHRGYFYNTFLPPEFLNTRQFRLRYIDPDKPDDSYLWYAQYRRIRRFSSSQFNDSIDGTDLIFDDEYLWDGKINRNNYTYIGKKELLCARHQDLNKTTRQGGQAIPNNLTFERFNTLVIDVINKDPNYVYSKRIWYLDPESYLILWTEIFDQLGRFWKCFMNCTCPLETMQGEKKMFIVGTIYEEFQSTHSGYNNQQKFFPIEISDPNIKPYMFTISHLQDTY